MTPDELFDEIAADLTARGTRAGAMFGKPGLRPDSELFDPSGRQRPFKDWVAVPVTQAQTWHHYAEKAFDRIGC